MNIKILMVSVLLLLSSFNSHAGLIITNGSIDSTSISFDISGTIEGPIPQSGLNWLFLVDTSRANGWINSFNIATITSNILVNGLSNGVDDFWVEPDFSNSSHDRLTLNNGSGWSIGDTLSGTFTATWASAIDLSGFNGLDVYWGRDPASFDESKGTFQGEFIRDRQSVPEPSTFAIFALGMVGLAFRRFKKQS